MVLDSMIILFVFVHKCRHDAHMINAIPFFRLTLIILLINLLDLCIFNG